MKNRSFPGLALLLAAAAALILTSALTRPAAAMRRDQAQLAVMQQLLPGSTQFTPEAVSPEDAPVTAAWRGEGGYIVEVCAEGYADKIVLWAGVDDAGVITGLTLRDLSETAGLGRAALHDEAFLAQFLHASCEPADYTLLTGATVTSRAVARAIGAASAYVTGAEIASSATPEGGAP